MLGLGQVALAERLERLLHRVERVAGGWRARELRERVERLGQRPPSPTVRGTAPSSDAARAPSSGSASACRSCRRRARWPSPSVSIAGDRRVSTCCCDSRQAPSARKMVSTTGNSSGSMAIAVRDAGEQPVAASLPRSARRRRRRAAAAPGPTSARSAPGRSVSLCKRGALGLERLERAPDLAHLGAGARSAFTTRDPVALDDERAREDGRASLAARPAHGLGGLPRLTPPSAPAPTRRSASDSSTEKFTARPGAPRRPAPDRPRRG